MIGLSLLPSGHPKAFQRLPVRSSREFYEKYNKDFIKYYKDKYGKKVDTIIEEARSRNADIVMFGHTHKPYFSQKDGLTVLNPGSLSYPRQDGRKPSYMVMEIDEEGKAHYEQKYL